jgi:serine/threonine-protein kinase
LDAIDRPWNEPSERSEEALTEAFGKGAGEQPRVAVTTSLFPPAPLRTNANCKRSFPPLLQTLQCADPAPRPLVSYPPPAASAGCGLGTVLDGRYKLESILGEGGMGIVYLARHCIIDKRVAVKVLRRDFAHDKAISERFLLEAKSASSIGNPHIVDISDFGRLPDGATYFVMEWLDGAPLSKLVSDGQRVPVARVLSIGRQIAEALFAAHQRGIVHRDLKADNIFLVKRGTDPDFVKILDFGIAKVMTGPDPHKTQVGALFGTPHYMSPEQAAGAPVDYRTDVYGLGVILYELASGRVPFEGNNLMEILTQHMYRAPVPIRSLLQPQAVEVPPGLDAIVMKALSKRPEQRYATMQEFARDLERLANGETPQALVEMRARAASAFPASAPAPKPLPVAAPARPPRRGRTRWDVYAGMTAVLMACGLTIGIFLRAESGRAQVPAGSPGSAAMSVTVPAVPSNAKQDSPIDVLFAAEPLDAHVFRAGVDLGSTPLTIEVPAGQRITVEVRRNGYATRSMDLDGADKKVTLKLVPESAPKKAPTAAHPKRLPNSYSYEVFNPWAPAR